MKEVPLDVTSKQGHKYKFLTLIFSVIQTVICVLQIIIVLAVVAEPGSLNPILKKKEINLSSLPNTHLHFTKKGYSTFFGNVDVNKSQTGLEFGFNLAVSSLGLIESIITIISSLTAKRGFVLAVCFFFYTFSIREN